MKKFNKTMIGLGVLLFLIAAALFVVLSGLDRIVAAAIRKYGSEATGTKVGVSSVKIGLKGGTGSIRGLSVGNPTGFSAPDAFRLGEISVEMEPGAVTSDPVVIDRVTILSPRVVYEIDREGRSNINLIRQRLQGDPAKEPAEKKAAEKQGRKLVIRRLVIDKGEMEIRVAALSGKPLSASLPRIELKNLGGEGGGSPAEIARQVLGPVLQQVAASASRAGIGQYLGKGADDLKKSLEDAAGGTLAIPGKDAAKGAGDALKKMLGN